MAVPGDPSLSRMWGCRGWSEQKGCCNPEPDPCHPQSKALRERWLLEGTPSSASEGDEDMRRQMQEDEQKSRLLEESISRWAGRAPARVWAGSPEEGLCGPGGRGVWPPCSVAVAGAGEPLHTGRGPGGHLARAVVVSAGTPPTLPRTGSFNACAGLRVVEGGQVGCLL